MIYILDDKVQSERAAEKKHTDLHWMIVCHADWSTRPAFWLIDAPIGQDSLSVILIDSSVT